jgi:hypothetical protein
LSISAANASALRHDYESFLQRASALFPKVDQKLLMSMLQYETEYSDLEGNVMLKVVYPAGTDIEKKKEWIYGRFQRMGSIAEGKTVRFKAIRFYVEDLDRLLSDDPQIEFVAGSATMAPSEAYSA